MPEPPHPGKERPIIFSAQSVRAILAGRKSQTRRVVKPPPPTWARHAKRILDATTWAWDEVPQGVPGRRDLMEAPFRCPYGAPGDRLWVRERWTPWPAPSGVLFYADATIGLKMADRLRWHSPLFLPRRLSRLTLEVLDVRVERLREISAADVLAEGIAVRERNEAGMEWEAETWNSKERRHLRDAYAATWDALNEQRGFGWETNCWVWVITFRRLTP